MQQGRRSDKGRQRGNFGRQLENKSQEVGVRFSLIKKNKAFQKNNMKVEVKKLLRAGMVPARTWGAHVVGLAPTERLQLRRQMAFLGSVRP